MFSSTIYRATRSSLRRPIRSLSTLQSNPHIYVFPDPTSPSSSHILTLLPTEPPSPKLAIGTSAQIPPSPTSLAENPLFLGILNSVLREHAASDPMVQGQAAAFASTSGSALGSGGMFFPQQSARKNPGSRSDGGGGGGASSQGGAGGGGRGGWLHVGDQRAPPDYGRIPWPEDIFGSLEVDGHGEFVKGDDGTLGNWQPSGTYRLVTREGILGLSDFLRGKLVERLREEEKKGV